MGQTVALMMGPINVSVMEIFYKFSSLKLECTHRGLYQTTTVVIQLFVASPILKTRLVGSFESGLTFMSLTDKSRAEFGITTLIYNIISLRSVSERSWHTDFLGR